MNARSILWAKLPSRNWVVTSLVVLLFLTYVIGLAPAPFTGTAFSLLFVLGWIAMPGNLMCNLGIVSSALPSPDSLPETIAFWFTVVVYWIGLLGLTIGFVITRRIVFLVGLVLILMFSAHGCVDHAGW